MVRIGNSKGIAIIYLALVIFVLCAFVGLAVDIGYMYVVKGQLQNAADATALASAPFLDGTSSTSQNNARNEAVAFAGKNVAGGQQVVVDANTTNSPGGDVVVGNWDPTRPQTPVDLRFLPTADGSNPLPPGSAVNAVKVVTRRSGASGSGIATTSPVSTFFARVIQWPFMSASAQAIAQRVPPSVISVPLCMTNCGLTTPLTGTTFYFNIAKGTPNVTWTTFLASSTNAGDVADYLTGAKPIPDLCSLPPPVCIYTTQGIVKPDMCVFIQQMREHSRHYTVNGTTIFGWKVFIPMLDIDSSSCGGRPVAGTGCFGDPGYQPGDAFPLASFAVAYILDAQVQGNCSGLSPHNTKGDEALIMTGGGPSPTPGSSTLQCVGCGGLAGELSNIVNLVK